MIFVGIIYASCEPSSSVLHELHANQKSNRFLSPELILLVLLTTLCFKVKMLLFSMHCIASAFGKHGYTNVHSHENSVLLPYLSGLVMLLSVVKGAATEPRVSCVLQPHDCH
jgi:hypothetical protein